MHQFLAERFARMNFLVCCYFFILFASKIDVHSTNIQLTPSEVHVIENSSATLTCSKTNGVLKETRWKNSENDVEANVFKLQGQCTVTMFLDNSDLYEGICNDNGTYAVVIKRIDRTQHGVKWNCYENRQYISNSAVIYVSVPATSVTLNQPNKDFVIENQTENIVCISSACRPLSRVHWYLRNSNDVYNLTKFSSNKYDNREYGLKSVESTLKFQPNRTMNGLRLYCEVWTRSGKADVTSREIILNVTYPPDSGPEIQGFQPNNIVNVIESETGTFVCSVTGGKPLASLRWYCLVSDDVMSNTDGNTVSSTIRWTALRGYTTCSCQANHMNNWKRTTNVTINVQYPPATPSLTIGSKPISGDVKVIRNNTLQIVCKSDSNPLPNYTWTGPGTSSKDGDTLKITRVQSNNQGLYICNVSNRMTRPDHSQKDGRNVSSIHLTMLYPPSTPNFRFENKDGRLLTSNVLNVVKHDTFTIHCDADGNPAPNVTWDNNIKRSSLTTTNILTDKSRTCTAKNEMKETASDTETSSTSSASLLFNVSYPPDTPTINVSNIHSEAIYGQGKTVSIIELETIYLTCFTNSKPMPTYQWDNDKSSEIRRDNKVTFGKISRNKTGTYFCNVENKMNRTNGTVQHGKNSSTITLNILYPATVERLENRSVVEGSHLEKHCPVIGGNPSNSTVVWSRLIDQSRWNNTLLYIGNVSRKDDSDYTCSAITYMFPTIGSQKIIVKNQSFHLNVFFQSEITSFSLSTSMSDTIAVINDTDDAPLLCIAAANPPSNLNISNPRGDSIFEIQNRNIARHTLSNTSYIDAGEYTCTGWNNYTKGLAPISHLILIIRNLPRPSSGDTSIVKVATILHVNVTLQFTASNYLDEPNKTVFSWLKENISISDNSSKYIIRIDGLQTNFTIRNTTRHDLGIYKVNVKNSIGEYIHYYDLKATDKPDPPIDFHVINDTITYDSVTLTWSPGFNGGLRQTFVILYTIKNDMNWLNKSINDNGNKNINYTLYDLASMHEYEIEMFAMNREGKSAHTQRLLFKTKEPLTNQAESKSTDNTGIIAGSISAVFVIIVALTIVFVVFFLRKRQNTKSDGLYQNVPFIGKAAPRKPKMDTRVKQKKTYSSQTEETTFKGNSSEKRKPKLHNDDKGTMARSMVDNEGLQEVDDVPIIMNERTEYYNSKDEIDKIKRITVAELYAYVFGNEDDLEIEYQKLPAGLQKPCTFARKPENIALNRYNGIYPYDHSRVKIPDEPDFFINACYIDIEPESCSISGYKRQKAYIASLGPTLKTTSDFKTFWKMIWHEKSDLIIILTNLNEISGMKCEQYWPDSDTELKYGDILVTSKTTDTFAEYTVRTFEVSKGNDKRLLTHLHYTAWPDKTVPEDVTSLLEFRKRIKDVPSTQSGPAVIHCSAGIGRTGTLIALDILIKEGLDTGSVNVFECVENIRNQRVKMVQTLEQYVYIHKALVNALSFESESFTRKQIVEHSKKENDRQYRTHFQQLKMSVETESTQEQKERTRNTAYTNKNRKGADIPGNHYRLFLQATYGREGADYINAVYVDSFKQKDHFITAQSPLPTTVTDFISMIYHGDCACIASMEDLKEPGMEVGVYFPEKNGTITAGKYEVTCSKFDDSSICVIRKMKIKYKGEIGSGEKCFYHFQYKKWMTGNKTPGDVADFVKFVQEVEEYADELGEDRSRVVVHCLKANERSCLFCAVAIIMEKLKYEGNVNILNIVRHLRTRRRTAIVSKEQLKFCYEAASAFVKVNKL